MSLMYLIPRKQAEVCSKEFLGNKNNINKILPEKATSHNDHYMINMGNKR